MDAVGGLVRLGAAPYFAPRGPSIWERARRWMLARWYDFPGDLPHDFDASRLQPNEGGGLSYYEPPRAAPFAPRRGGVSVGGRPKPPATPLPGPGASAPR